MSSLFREPYRIPSVLRDLQLARDAIGRRYGHTPWLQLLRQGINSHRLAWGVLRIGGTDAAAVAMKEQSGVEWVTLGHRQCQHWQPLLQLELLDAVALQEPPPEEGAGAASYRLLPCANGWLACRLDPEVLQLAASLCER